MNRNVFALFPSLYNRIRWRTASGKLKRIGKNSSVGRRFSLTGAGNIAIGDSFAAGSFLKLQTWEEYRGEKTGILPELIIGSNVSIMDNCHISCAMKIMIGDGVLLGDNVFITDNFHGTGSKEESDIPPIARKLYCKGEVIIGKNVWIGRNVCIMPGVTIGDGATIGANAVVTHDIPAACMAAGVPAQVVKLPQEED